MTLATDMMWDVNPPTKLSLPAIRYQSAAAFAAVVGAGVAISMWSMATVATLHTMESSVTSASRLLPESAVFPGTVALVDPFHRIAKMARSSISPLAAGRFGTKLASNATEQASGADGRSARYASTVVDSGKSGRIISGRSGRVGRLAAATTPLDHRFDQVVAQARLTPEKQAAAFARPTRIAAEAERSSRVALADTDSASSLPSASEVPLPVSAPAREVSLAAAAPADTRFGGILPDQAPVPDREPAEAHATAAATAVTNSASMALAAVENAQPDGADQSRVPLPQDAPLRRASLPADATADDDTAPARGALADAMPDTVPLPTRRPELDGGIPFKPAAPAPRQAEPMLAYAKPDAPVEREQPTPFNKFALPGAGSGVAVYDIKAATVYMPNGDRLEAHSGLGRFTDDPSFVNRKDVGPTPPNTYKLTMRQDRFHGVEAIRMTPVTDQKMYGRDGFLVHTYMLRGRYAQSNGCVVFKNYEKFLSAFKRGRITTLVVVPTLAGHPVVASQHHWNIFHIGEDNRGA